MYICSIISYSAIIGAQKPPFPSQFLFPFLPPFPSPKLPQGTIVLPTLGWYRLVELGIFPSKAPRCDRSSQNGSPKR